MLETFLTDEQIYFWEAHGFREKIFLLLAEKISQHVKDNVKVLKYLVANLSRIAKKARLKPKLSFDPTKLASKKTWYEWDDLGFYKHLFMEMGQVDHWNKSKLTALAAEINKVRLATAHKDKHVLTRNKFMATKTSYDLVMKQLKNFGELWIA